MDLSKYIRSIKDYPKKGILFRDITTLIKDENAFKECVDQLTKIIKNLEFDKIAAIEARGFIFASAVSYNLSKPLILMRKKNKLPAETHSVEFELEYGKATIEIHKDAVNKNEKIIIIDDSKSQNLACENLINFLYDNCDIQKKIILKRKIENNWLYPISDEMVIDYQKIKDGLQIA